MAVINAEFQEVVWSWCRKVFDSHPWHTLPERSRRFLEEALELVQAAGLTAEAAHKLVDYVYGRPLGDTRQEVGGVVVTLAALATAASVDMAGAALSELSRIHEPHVIAKVRAKQELKTAVGVGYDQETK